MFAHVRANLLLLGLTLLVGSVLYPLAILLLAQGFFNDKANGSLLRDAEGKVIGSRLLAQEFQQARYFQPRPSATGYNAADSGGSNLAASNPQLRDRVARQLHQLAHANPEAYPNLKAIGKEIEAWLAARGESAVSFWVKNNPRLAEAWLNDKDNSTAVKEWLKDQEAHASFFASFARQYPSAFFDVQDNKIVPVREGAVIQRAFFDLWLREQPDRARELEAVPADQVTTSASGLDPHITLRNARTQVPRVIDAWVKEGKIGVDSVRETVEKALRDQAFTPLLGNEPLVNVLEVNHVLKQQLEK